MEKGFFLPPFLPSPPPPYLVPAAEAQLLQLENGEGLKKKGAGRNEKGCV